MRWYEVVHLMWGCSAMASFVLQHRGFHWKSKSHTKRSRQGRRVRFRSFHTASWSWESKTPLDDEVCYLKWTTCIQLSSYTSYRSPEMPTSDVFTADMIRMIAFMFGRALLIICSGRYRTSSQAEAILQLRPRIQNSTALQIHTFLRTGGLTY